MTLLYLLDTNMVSYIVRRRSPAARVRLLALKDGEVGALSTVTVAEIRYGLAKRPEATALKALMESFLAGIQILPWGQAEAEAYGLIRVKLERSGMSLDSMDLMIAAHAVAKGAVLVTNDQAFAQVEELSAIVNWATDL